MTQRFQKPSPSAAGASAVSTRWSWRQAVPSDGAWTAELRAVVMRPDLERLGRYGPSASDAASCDDDPRPMRLNVLQGSAARRLYERHGFVVEREDDVDVWMVEA